MSGCDRVLVDGGAGFRGGSATVTQVRRLARHGDQRGAPAIVVDFAQIPEIAYGLHAEARPLRLVLLPAAANPSNLHMVDYSTGLVMQRAHMAIDIAYSVRKTA